MSNPDEWSHFVRTHRRLQPLSELPSRRLKSQIVMSQLRVGKRTVPWAEERAPKVDVCRLATPRRGLVQACCGARIRQREQRKKHSQQLGHTQFNSSTNKLSVLRARESICQ